MLDVVLKDSTLGVIDDATIKSNNELYKPTKAKDDNIANLLSDEDLYSEYDDKGNKIVEYKPQKVSKKGESLSSIVYCIITSIFLVILLVLLRQVVALV